MTIVNALAFARDLLRIGSRHMRYRTAPTAVATATIIGSLLGTIRHGHAAPSNAQLCESAYELLAGNYAKCRLTAERKFSLANDTSKRASAMAKCAGKLTSGHTKAILKYGATNCTTETSTAFDEYLTQCADDAEAASKIGGSLPNYLEMLATCTGNLAACQSQAPAKVLRTGQATCWNTGGTTVPCANSGQDGEFQKGMERSYLDNGDGTISDTRTGLMWEKLADDGGIHDKDNLYSWADALGVKIDDLNTGSGFAGHTDWRIPNILELHSLVNYANSAAVAAEFQTPTCMPGCTVLTCSCTGPTAYWSSSTDITNLSAAWMVGFFDGAVFANAKSSSFRARAVRGGP